MIKTNHVTVEELNFDQLFKQISPEEICDNVFTLVGKDFFVITAGKENHYNSMVGSVQRSKPLSQIRIWGNHPCLGKEILIQMET
jgi:hypothetical protein